MTKTKQNPRSMAVASHIGPIVKRARKAAKMTQGDLGRALGLTGQTACVTIALLEGGQYCPSLPRLFDLASCLGIHPKQLLDETTFA